MPGYVPAGPLDAAQFTDDFNRSNRTLTDNGWTNVVSGASLDIVSNRARFTSGATSGGWGNNVGSPTPNANHWAAAQVVSGSAGNIVGVVARYFDTNSFYIFRMARNAGDVWQLYKRVAGTYTLLGSLSEAAPAEPWYMRIYCVGTSIKGQLWNGTAWVDKVTATDSALSTGKPGFFAQQVGTGPIEFDNYASGTAT
jgi:hypothetical protein